MTKKKNPADATLRNTRAAKKRTDTLDDRVDRLEARVQALEAAQPPKTSEVPEA